MRYELADYEWAAVRPFLPNKPRGVPRVSDWRVLNGIFWVLRYFCTRRPHSSALQERPQAELRQVSVGLPQTFDMKICNIKLKGKSMTTKLLVCALISCLLMSSANAQVTIDVAKITCEQFVRFSVADPEKIAMWLSGYHHGKVGDTVAEPQEFKENIAKLRSARYLGENSKLPVMEVAEKTLFAK